MELPGPSATVAQVQALQGGFLAGSVSHETEWGFPRFPESFHIQSLGSLGSPTFVRPNPERQLLLEAP